MTPILKPLPTFADEAEERRYWETHDSTEYVNWEKAVRVCLPNLTNETSIFRQCLNRPRMAEVTLVAQIFHRLSETNAG
jgi:hypothetical protein